MPDGAQQAVGVAQAYGERLLADLARWGAQPQRTLQVPSLHPALAWADSGLMWLTGRPDTGPQMCPAPLAACAEGVLAALAGFGPCGALDGIEGAQLLGERAAITGYSRAGSSSPGGSCRLLAGKDGWIALNLVRPEDWALMPAWLETPDEFQWPENSSVGWSQVRRALLDKPVQGLVERGRLMGLAVSLNQAPAAATPSWCSISRAGTPRQVPRHVPLVVDLSSLWAGPLCSHLLQKLGAQVIKIESPQRTDGARRGPTAFFDLLNAGKRSVALDPSTPYGREQLLALLRKADIVIEASRPRALRQMGIHAEAVIQENPGLTWLSITGYGRESPYENWVAYGDDAGVAAGLSQLMFDATDGELLICGDAIADPLTGLHAALAGWAGFQGGGGKLISLSLRDVVGHCVGFDLPGCADTVRNRYLEWTDLVRKQGDARMPRARQAAVAAPPLGADTQQVLKEWAITN